MHEGPDTLADLLASLLQRNVKTEQMAEALAVLEDDLRRTDPLGECVRWLARGRRRDLISFPERVSLPFITSFFLPQLPCRWKTWFCIRFKS
jgi:hypothetical protein